MNKEQTETIVRDLAANPDFVATLAGQQGWIARDVLAGRSVATIAKQHHLSELVIWRILGNAARLAAGRPRRLATRPRAGAASTIAADTLHAGDDTFGSSGPPTSSTSLGPWAGRVPSDEADRGP